MTGGARCGRTWTGLGIVVSVGLVLFGVVDAALPRATPPGLSLPTADLADIPAPHRTLTTGRRSSPSAHRETPADVAAQRTAEQFAMATGTTDPAHPEGDTAALALLAPGLAIPRRRGWPEAWVTEDRRTTVALDPPGPVVVKGSGQVAVVITGRTVVATGTGPTTEIPVDETITLRPVRPAGSDSSDDRSRWVVTDVGAGS